MSTDTKNNGQTGSSNTSTTKPDPETLHTTDPQEHMDGPLSSLMKKTGEGFEDEANKTDDDDTQNS